MIPPPHPAYKPPSNGVHSAAGNFLQDRGLSILFLALSIIFALGAFFAYHYGLHNLVTLSFGILGGVSFVCFLGSFFFKKTPPPPVPPPIENPVLVEDTVPGNEEIEKVVSIPPPNSSTKSPALSNTKGILLSGTQEDSQGRIPLQEDEKTTNAHEDSSSEIAKDETNLSKKKVNSLSSHEKSSHREIENPVPVKDKVPGHKKIKKVVSITSNSSEKNDNNPEDLIASPPQFVFLPPTVPFPPANKNSGPLPSYHLPAKNSNILPSPNDPPLPPGQLSDDIPPDLNQVSPKTLRSLGNLVPIFIYKLRKETDGFTPPAPTLAERCMHSYYGYLVDPPPKDELPKDEVKRPPQDIEERLYRHLRCHKNPALLTTIYHQPYEKISLEHLDPATLSQVNIQTIDWSQCRCLDLANWKIDPTQFPELLRRLVVCEEFQASTPLSPSIIEQLLQLPTLSSASIVLENDLEALKAWDGCTSQVTHLSCTLPHLNFLEPFLAKISSFENLQSLDLWIEQCPTHTSVSEMNPPAFKPQDLIEHLKNLKHKPSFSKTKISLFCSMLHEVGVPLTEGNYHVSCVHVNALTRTHQSKFISSFLSGLKRFKKQCCYHSAFFGPILYHYRNNPETLARILGNLSMDATDSHPDELQPLQELAQIFCDSLSEENLLLLFQKKVLFDLRYELLRMNQARCNLILEYFLRSAYQHAVSVKAEEKARIISNFICENYATFMRSYVCGVRFMRKNDREDLKGDDQ